MCKSEIFAEIISLVEEETEVPREQILSDNKEMEVVDARYILVYLLHERGLYPSTISKLIHKSKRSVSYIITNFDDRAKNGKILRIQLNEIRNKIGIK